MTYLLDTNLLVYAMDERDSFKLSRARAVLDGLLEPARAVVSSQVLAEFSNVALRKLKWTPDEYYALVESFESIFGVIPLTPAVVLEALRGVKQHGLSYYDAQIWSAAKLHQVRAVLSEDFQAGRSIEGVRFENPFDETFDLSWLG